VQWNDIDVEAAVPDPVVRWTPNLAERTVRETERAAAAVARFGERTLGAAEVSARLLLRAEGVASSAIEGLRASAADVALAEVAAEAAGPGGVALWVADNLAVVSEALVTPAPLTVERVLAWHRRLMRHDMTLEPGHVGAWRDELGWVGGANPRLAVHVAAPEGDIPELMDDLLAFIARADVDPVTAAAVAHAQFETIHPFADGNGRIGRVLIGWMLCQRLSLRYPPPVSLQMARDVGGYQSGLTLYRQDQIDHWVSWFANAVMLAATTSTQVLAQVAEVQRSWRESLGGLRRDAAARRLCDELPAHPVVSALTAAELLGVSRQAASTAIAALEQRGVLVPLDTPAAGRNPRERWWAAGELLTLLGGRSGGARGPRV
jgi:Fic family protein